MENKILKAIENLDKKFEKRFDSLEKRMDKIEKRMDILDSRMDKIDSKTGNIESRIDKIDSKISILESQTKENTQILQALRHSAEVNKAEHDQMMRKIDNMQGDLAGLRKDLSTMEVVTASNYNDIARLKAVR